MSKVCFFHAGCPDGFGAAWAVWRVWGDGARFVPRGHDDALTASDYVDDLVVFVDIAPPNESLRELAETAGQIIVLDHHISSRDRYEADPSLVERVRSEGHHVEFELAHSGAMLAWQHFHPGEPAPELLRYVEDQDLWHWQLANSREVNAAIGSRPRSFDAWDALNELEIDRLAEEGAPIVRAQEIEVERSLLAAHPVQLGSFRIEAVNAGYQRSQIGHELALRSRFGSPCGLVYRITGRRVDCSVYSTGDFDVAEIAAGLGGGGHRNAAGFSVSLEDWLADFC